MVKNFKFLNFLRKNLVQLFHVESVIQKFSNILKYTPAASAKIQEHQLLRDDNIPYYVWENANLGKGKNGKYVLYRMDLI